ncbi:MAG: DUF1573 domain-containing protein [Planctomycetaceae bacterium]|jgi:hypothetical protein|nr:DUF1573 domain-containing protein [Planctomycetaceae bacterium]
MKIIKQTFLLASFVLCAGVLIFGFFRCGTVIYWKLQNQSLVRNGVTYDFGTVSVGDNCTNEFEIRNTGGGDLVIHKVVASCGACVEITDYTKTPIPSGQSGTITLTLLTRHLEGKISKDVLVETNDPKQPHIILTLEAEVVVPEKSDNNGIQQRTETTQ